MTRDDLKNALDDSANVRAFLRVIREGESSQDDSAYTVINGGAHFDAPPWVHPWHGIPTTQGARACGVGQFLGTTWANLVKQYGFPDFSPPCQLEGMVALIAGRGALQDVLAGRLESAIVKLRPEWTSLPGAAEQGRLTLDKARAVYEVWGGLYGPVPAQPGPPIESEQPPAPVDDLNPPQPEPSMAISQFASIALQILRGVVPDLAPIIDKASTPGAKDGIANDILQLAQKVTATGNAQAAVEKIQADPAVATAFRAEVSKKQDEWLGTVTRLADLDAKSVAAAREFSMATQRVEVVGSFSFLEFLSMWIVLFSMVAGSAMVIWGDLSPDLKGAIVMTMLIGGFTSIIAFWFGSSLGSMQKNGPQKPAETKP